MRRQSFFLLALGALALAATPAFSLERELAGVELGQRALELLSNPRFGTPDYVGPLGNLGASAPSPTTAGQGVAGMTGMPGMMGMGGAGMPGMMPGAGMPGMMPSAGMPGAGAGGPAMMMAGPGAAAGAMPGMPGMMPGMGGMPGMPGMMPGAGAAPGASAAETPGAAGAAMPGMMPGGAGMPGMMPGMGGMPGMPGMPGMGMPGVGELEAAPGMAPAGATTIALSETVWMYRRGGARILITISEEGRVTNIILQGSGPSSAGRTSYNIGLAATPGMIFATYGLPDRTVALSDGLEYTYLDHGVRFTLRDFQVSEIMIGERVSEAAAAVVAREKKATRPKAKAGPTPGLSLDTLRGYM